MGGARQGGGLYGAPCFMTDLEGGDQIYPRLPAVWHATVIEQWWGLPAVSIRRQALSGGVGLPWREQAGLNFAQNSSLLCSPLKEGDVMLGN